MKKHQWFLIMGGIVAAGALLTLGQSEKMPVEDPTSVGVIVAFAGATNSIPVERGWLLCDGRELRRERYPELFGMIGTAWGGNESSPTFRIPDLRGRFLRGVAHDAPPEREEDRDLRTASAEGGNAGNAVGSLQQDSVKLHTHSIAGVAQATGPGGPDTPQYIEFQGRKIPNPSAPELYKDVMETGETEGRPKNAYVNWIIKAR